MPDDRNARDKQGADEERRQREREIEAERDRGSEAEPVRDVPGERLGDLDEALGQHDYPATTDDPIATYGDYEVETKGAGSRSTK